MLQGFNIWIYLFYISLYILKNRYNSITINTGGIYMSLDGIVTRAIVKELSHTILGGRIDKIYQQWKDELC